MQRRCTIEQIMYMSLALSRTFLMAPNQTLLNTIVPAGEANPFFYFSDGHDIALGLLTDGFAPFKKCDKMCWPIILFNYNLPPEICFQKKYCIHCHSPGSKKALELGFLLLATCSRADPTRA